MASRDFTTRRLGIVDGLVSKLKDIDGSVHLNAGSETRQYQGGGQKDRFLTVTIRCYVQAEDAVQALDELLEDVETVVEENSRLLYKDRNNADQYTHQITVISIDTDEGVLEPMGVGEMLLEVHY
jgi:hypothetical protein